MFKHQDFQSFCWCFSFRLGKPPPPIDFIVENVQTRYLILTWDEPVNASLHQIQSYTIERWTSRSKNITKTVPYPESKMIMKDLEPSTEYTLRLSSNNMYGRSDGVFLTQNTLPGNHPKPDVKYKLSADLSYVSELLNICLSIWVFLIAFKIKYICASVFLQRIIQSSSCSKEFFQSF